jgi:hypothetical protein
LTIRRATCGAETKKPIMASQFGETIADEEIIVADNKIKAAGEQQENDARGSDQERDEIPESSQEKEADSIGSTSHSVLSEISVFRDFFLAAFSDGYYNNVCFVLHVCISILFSSKLLIAGFCVKT